MSKIPSSFKFLLDANLSPETARYLRKQGFDAQSIQGQKLGHLTDEQIIKLAKKDKCIIITFDYDFAELWYFKQRGQITVIHLRNGQSCKPLNSSIIFFWTS